MTTQGLLLAFIATIGGFVTWRQKNQSDRRSEWWRRTAWSFERTLSGDEVQAELGWNALAAQGRSKLATKDDADMIQVITQHRSLRAARAAVAGRSCEQKNRSARSSPEGR